MTVQQSGALIDSPAGQSALVRHCDGCGAVVAKGMVAKLTLPRWGDVWFCDECSQTLSRDEIERTTHEIALRGVPLA